MQHNTQWLLLQWIMYFTQIIKKCSRGACYKSAVVTLENN